MGLNQLPVFTAQMAALVQDISRNFYLAKNHKIDNSSTTTKARVKISVIAKSIEF
jgi:hypothetical protein